MAGRGRGRGVFLNKLNDVAAGNHIYDRCLSNIDFISVGVSLFNSLLPLQVPDFSQKFRSVVLNLVQQDFKGRKGIRYVSTEKFACFTSVLCQIFITFRIKDKLLSPLVGPVCESLEDLITGDANEIDTLFTQLQDCGKLLQECDAARLEQLMMAVRREIIANSKSPRSRSTLLQLVECHARNWEPLGADISKFYCDPQVDGL
ncbi:CBP80/20-dependent translation initiation factor-like isoform X2 [Tubulanus polymorphus]|uniref:CBP80/20-dependent translation initiation factor-like isoform X2 n=1 Tax=Tubulanus polymorphus TaxID=672921 RepID=UPI003DA284E6